MGAEGVPPPGDTRDVGAGLAEERIIDGHGERSLGRQLGEDAAADDGEEVGGGQAVAGEEAILRRPVLELAPAGSQQTSHGMTTQAEQAAQREGLRPVGEALLREGGAAFSPELLEGGEDAGRVFFRIGAGG